SSILLSFAFASFHPEFGGNMKRLVFFILITGLLAAESSKADTGAVDPEIDAIRAVADAYISADPAKLRDAFLPSANLYTDDDTEAVRTTPFAEYLRSVSPNPRAGPGALKASINSVQRTGNVAIVKVTTVR